MIVFLSFHAYYTSPPSEVFKGIALAVALPLLGLLLLKELSTFQEGDRWRRLGRALNFAIAPLLAGFLAGVGLRIADALR